ncbi:MAG: pirin-like C-terminal cupin domain-containing protein, partial [Pseudomonadota bacterium]|nr:pirin-like C-terminal cupin domain-containing protein [Pseudomonadota bacterium]
VQAGELALLTQGDELSVGANQETSFLFLAARPLGEPVAKGGPFVMNTREEIEQAFDDYKHGRFAQTAALA